MFMYEIPGSVFADSDNHLIQFSATDTTGSALPAWLIFDPRANAFAGRSPAADSTLGIRVSATDGYSAPISDSFILQVNQSPVITAIPDCLGVCPIGPGSYSYDFATTHVTDTETLTYELINSDGTAIPTWMIFNSLTEVLYYTVTTAESGIYNLKFIAKDSCHEKAKFFKLEIN